MDWRRLPSSRWGRRALWALGAYALFAAVAWKGVPALTRRVFAAVPRSLPGFSAGAREVSFDPFTLRWRADGLFLRHETLGELASCRELSVALDPLAVFRLALGLREIRLVDPKLTLVVAKDGTSVLDVLPKAPKGEKAKKPSGPGFIPRVIIGALEVQSGALEFDSLLPSAPQKVSVRPIDFRLENLSTIPDDGGRYDLRARTNRGESLSWNGTLTVRPARLSGRVAVAELDLTRLSTAAPGAPVAFEAGRLGASSDYEIRLDSGVVTATLKDARVSVKGLLWRLKAVPEKEPRGPFSLAVGPAQVETVAAGLGTPDGKVTLRAEVPVASSGTVSLRAYVSPQPLSGGVDLQVASLPLAPFSPLAPPPTRMTLDSGALSAKLHASYAAGAADADASLSVSDFRLSGAERGGALVRFSRFAVDGARLSTKRRSVSIAAVRLDRPFLRLARDKSGRTNVESAAGLSLFASTAAAKTEPSAPPAAPGRPGPAWKVSLKRFALSGGRVLVRDDSVAPPFALNVTGARADLSDLANDSRSTATFSASAEVERAPVGLDGTLRLSTAAAWGVAKVTGKDIQLPLFSAYSGKYAGYKIDKGSFGFDLDDRIDGRRIMTKNHAVVDQMTFGDKVDSPDATKAPVKLGLAILKDRNGVIDLTVPVDGSLDDPSFHLLGAVMKTLGNLVVKAALSPFSALSALAGSKGDMGQVAFPAGASTLDASLGAQLDTVAKFLNDKPEMLVGVRGAATKADALARGDRELLRRLRGKNASSAPLTPKEESRVLSLASQALGASASSAAQARADLDARWRANDADMRALALSRAEAVKAALTARGVDAKRFFSLEPVSGADAPDEPTQLQLDVR